jgi:hypothetical protein
MKPISAQCVCGNEIFNIDDPDILTWTDKNKRYYAHDKDCIVDFLGAVHPKDDLANRRPLKKTG